LDFSDFICFFRDGNLTAFKPKKEIQLLGNKIVNELSNGNESYLLELSIVNRKINNAICLCLDAKQMKKHHDLNLWWFQTQEALSEVASLLYSFDFSFAGNIDYPSHFTRSFIDEAKDYLLKLHEECNGDLDVIHSLFIEEWGWIQNSYRGVVKIEKKFILEFLSAINYTNSNKAAHTSHVHDDLITRTLIEAISVHDNKKKLLLIAVELMDLWLENFIIENQLKKEDLLWLTMDELLNNDISEIRKLSLFHSGNKSRAGLMTSDGYATVDHNLLKKIISAESPIEEKCASGQVACSGKAIGRAKIVLDPRKESAEFFEGDILITSMTRPEYLSLMSRAAAFVTDEGGISCHAAIISREMRKPCIIGTKIATKMFKSGDLIEVDADKGIIRKLS
jgi:phosphohistidine swiveling domain-containing protein